MGPTRARAAEARAARTPTSDPDARVGGGRSGGGGRGRAPAPFDGAIDPGGAPASRRALRNQGRRTMRKLLDAAMQAFDQRGYHATRVNDVVEIAKTSHGTFYLYFSNKEDLLRALVAEAAEEAGQLYTTLADAGTSGASWGDIRAWIGLYSALWTRYAPLLRAWTELAAVDPELGVQIRRAVNAMCGALALQIESSAGGGQGVDRHAAGMAVVAMLDRFHYLREFVGTPIDDHALDTLATIVYRGLFVSAPATGA